MEKKKCWVVVQIGCIECGTPSEVKGVFMSEEDAEEYCEKNPWDSWEKHGGDGYQKVFESEIND